MDFSQLKSSLAKANKLYEDPDFPATGKVLAEAEMYDRSVKWLRPWDLVDKDKTKPKFIAEGATRFDLNQGEIGDCWFVAAVACLAVSHEQLFNRCVPTDQDFETEYAGMFRFNFWQFGRWVEVIIDDRLPTLNGQLIYARNQTQPYEFWAPLIEKAYAKISGGYDVIGKGGHTCNALVDFTGGISESIDLRKYRMAPTSLFDTTYAMMQKCSMLGCDIESKVVSSTPERSGLFKGHAYSITNMIRLTSKGKMVRLLRLRNPWGKNEWNGKWSDRSHEWDAIPLKAKQDIGLEVMEDGEFWMSYEDWVSNFDFLWLCHLEPDAVSEEISQAKGRTMWEVTKYEYEWIRGLNAGGCGNPPFADLFWKNPQFNVSLTTPSGDAKSKDAHVVVSLMQESTCLQKNLGISFMVYKVKEGTPLLLDGENYDRNVLKLAENGPTFINLREVTSHYELAPGNYVIIPCTFQPNQEAKFMLRVYTETQTLSQELDVPTTVGQPPVADNGLSLTFSKFANGETEMDAKELTSALNEIFVKDVVVGFTADAARNLIALIGKSQIGVIIFVEFQRVVQEVTTWKEKFAMFDRDKSGDIDMYEMSDAFKAIGIQLSRKVMESIVRRYGGKKRRLCLEDFVLCSCRITVLYAQFKNFAKTGVTDKAELNLEQWLSEAV